MAKSPESIFEPFIKERGAEDVSQWRGDHKLLLQGFNSRVLVGGASGGTCMDEPSDEGAVYFEIYEHERSLHDFSQLRSLIKSLAPPADVSAITQQCLDKAEVIGAPVEEIEYYGNFSIFEVKQIKYPVVASLIAASFKRNPRRWILHLLSSPEKETRLLGNALAAITPSISIK